MSLSEDIQENIYAYLLQQSLKFRDKYELHAVLKLVICSVLWSTTPKLSSNKTRGPIQMLKCGFFVSCRLQIEPSLLEKVNFVLPESISDIRRNGRSFFMKFVVR